MNEPVTIIGPGTMVNGNLEGDEDLNIEGRVEGTISLSRTLTIENNGVVHANINVRNAIISGVLVGNVEAEESVHITEEGRVVGDIKAPRVILVDGASFRGSIDMGDFDVERGSAKASSAERIEMPAARPAPAYSRDHDAPSAKPDRVQTRAKPAPVRRPEPRPAAPAPKIVPPVAKAEPEAPAKVETSAPPEKPAHVAAAPDPRLRAIGKAKAVRKKKD